MKQMCLGEEEAGYFGSGYSETPFAGWYVVRYLEEGRFDLHPAHLSVPDGAIVVGTEETHCTYRALMGRNQRQWVRGFRLMQRYGEGQAWLSFSTPRAVRAIVSLGGRPDQGQWITTEE